MQNYQEILSFLSTKLGSDLQSSLTMQGGSASSFVYKLSDAQGKSISLFVELERDAMHIRMSPLVVDVLELSEWLKDLEFKLEQSRGCNVKTRYRFEDASYYIDVET